MLLDRVEPGTGLARIIGPRGEVRQAIVDTTSPPLSPRTVASKGFAKPLVDTGHMLNSVASEVAPIGGGDGAP